MPKPTKEQPKKTPVVPASIPAARQSKSGKEATSLNAKAKQAQTSLADPRKNFSRNKSFAVGQSLDTKLAKKEIRNRPYSVAASLNFSNKVNMGNCQFECYFFF